MSEASNCGTTYIMHSSGLSSSVRKTTAPRGTSEGRVALPWKWVFWFILNPGALVHRQALPIWSQLIRGRTTCGEREGMKTYICFNTGVPNLWGLMPDDLKWSWYNNNRNKAHNKCNALESSGGGEKPSPYPLALGKIVFHEIGPWCQKVRDCCSTIQTTASQTLVWEWVVVYILREGIGKA